MTLPETWIEHRREDGELVGWIEPVGEQFVTHDILGRRRTAEPVDWLEAEEDLESAGIGFLAEIHALRLEDGTWVRARITEVSSERVGVKADDLGAVGVPVANYHLDFPVDDRLVLLADAPGPVRGPFD
ncbi:hypothetical protein [Leucobacter luti]|uniref:hypothetical protein n=1 Tax=Leucobacter luti TaxID=340320 RepID=UPI003D0743A6